jgi:hypothetical protein
VFNDDSFEGLPIEPCNVPMVFKLVKAQRQRIDGDDQLQK